MQETEAPQHRVELDLRQAPHISRHPEAQHLWVNAGRAPLRAGLPLAHGKIKTIHDRHRPCPTYPDRAR